MLIKDDSGKAIDMVAEVSCADMMNLSERIAPHRSCQWVASVEIDKHGPSQPIHVGVRSLTGQEIPLEVTLARKLAERIRARQGPYFAPH